jgi:hypothetical protein
MTYRFLQLMILVNFLAKLIDKFNYYLISVTVLNARPITFILWDMIYIVMHLGH